MIKLSAPFFRNFRMFKIWWLFVILFVLFFGTNIWVFPTLNRLKENALDIQRDSALLARRSVENFNSFHFFTSLFNTASFLAIMSEKKDAIISKLFQEQKHFTEVAIFNEQGEITDYYRRKGKGAERAEPSEVIFDDRAELFEKSSSGKIYTGSVIFAENSLPYLTIAQPIYSDGSFSGVLALKSDLSFLREKTSLSVLKTRGEEQIYIVDEKGNLIVHTGYPEGSPGIKTAERKIVSEILKKEQGRVAGSYINEKGEKVQATAVLYKFLGWGVVVEEPATKIFAARNSILFLAILMIIGQLFLMGLLARNAFSLIKTTENLKESRGELEEAKQVLEVKVGARTRELKEMAKNLEVTVQERTKNLQDKIEELEKFHRLTVGRETKMVELKEEIKKLKNETES